MAQLRKFQFLRNELVAGPFDDHATAINQVDTALSTISVKDGELVLYRYKIKNDETVHTQVVVAYVKEQEEQEPVKKFEIVANYDQLVNSINSLNFNKTQGELVKVQVKQENGQIKVLNVDDSALDTELAAIRADFAAADADITTAYQAADAAITTAYKAADAVVRGEFAAADADITTAYKAADDAITTAYKAADDVVRGEFAAADTALGARIDGVVDTIKAMDLPETQITTIDGTAVKTSKIKQVDGVVTVASADLFTTTSAYSTTNPVVMKAELDAATAATTYTEGNGIDISNNVVSAVVKEDDKVLSVNADGLQTSISLSYVSADKKIYLKGINGADLGSVPCEDFIHDGMLSSAKLVQDPEGQEAGTYIELKWNTDGSDDVENNPMYINVTSLIDIYTADEVYLTVSDNKFSHKTVDGLDSTNTHGSIQRNDTGVTGNNLTNAGESITLNIPILKVDAAGHVTRIDEYTTKISLPASINTAIQGGAGINTTYIHTTVARNATNTNQLDVTATAQIGDYANEGQVDGLATTATTKVYVDSKIQALDDSMTTVAQGAGISVSDAGTGNDHAYTVALAAAPATETLDTDDYVAANGQHTRISDITVDNYGRVTAVTKTTVTENFDAGTY